LPEWEDTPSLPPWPTPGIVPPWQACLLKSACALQYASPAAHQAGKPLCAVSLPGVACGVRGCSAATMGHSVIIAKGDGHAREPVGKGIAIVLVAAVGALSAGCFGKFQLTRKLYDVNQSIDEKYVRSAATWFLVIIPVYEIVALLRPDRVSTLIEFWTGENPVVSAPVTKVYARGNGRTGPSPSPATVPRRWR